MGIFTYVDPQTQRSYRFEHAGDAPTDEDYAYIANILQQDRAAYAQKYEQFYGEAAPEYDDGTAFGRGWSRGVQGAKGGIGELLQTMGEKTGADWLASYGTGVEERARQRAGELSLEQPAALGWRDVSGVGSGLTYLGELTGESALYMGAGVGGALAGAAAAPYVGATATVGAGLGSALATLPMYTGENLQEQEQVSGEGNVSLGKAAATGTFQAALDTASLGVLGKLGVGKAVTQALSGEVGRGLTQRILSGTATGVAAEGTTEAIQELATMWQAGKDLNSPEAQERLAAAFIGGGVLGGAIGGVGRGALGKRPGEADPAPTPAPSPAEAEAPKPLGLPVPGMAEARPAREAPDVVPIQPLAGQTRPDGNVPALSPEATALANNLTSEPQLMAATKAIEAAGKATVDVIREALGVSNPAARGIMRKLEGAGIVSKYEPGKPRRLTLPFEISAVLPVAPTPAAPEAVAEPETAPTPAAPEAVAEPETAPTLAAPEAVAEPETAPTPAAPVTTPEYSRNAAPGRTTNAAGQVIPAGVRPVEGRGPEGAEQARRAPIAQQMSRKTALEAEIADLKKRIGTGTRTPDALRAEAKRQGVKPTALKKQLQTRLNKAQAELYPIASYLRSEAGKAQAAEEGVAAFAGRMQKAENDAARSDLRRYYTENAPEDIKRYNGYDTPTAREDTRDPSSASDKRSILDIMQRAASRKLGGPKFETARAAATYFSKVREVADALELIAADIGIPDVPGKYVGTKTEPLHPFYKGMGRTPATKAAQWVRDNMSPDTVAFLDKVTGEYAIDTVEASVDARNTAMKEQRKTRESDQKTLGEYYSAQSAVMGEAMEIETGSYTLDELRAMDAERVGSDLDLIDSLGKDFGNRLRHNPAHSIDFGLKVKLHPAVQKALRQGRLREALQGIAATTVDPYVRRLVSAMLPYIEGVKVWTSNDPNVLNLLTSSETGEVFPGTYVLMTKENYAEVAQRSPEYAADMQNSILIHKDMGMNAHTVLHEVTHAVTLRELLNNPNGAVAQRLTALWQQSKDAVAKDAEYRGDPEPYGFDSVEEFVAEALSNRHFQQLLSRLYPTTKRVTAYELLMRALSNFVRRLMGQPAKTYDDSTVTTLQPSHLSPTIFNEVDYLTKSIFSAAPDFRAEPSLFDTAKRPLAAQGVIDGMYRLSHPFTKADAAMTRAAVMRSTVLDKAQDWTMPTFLNLFTPLRNLADLAKPYFPNADAVVSNITENADYVQKLSGEINRTLGHVHKFLDKNKGIEERFHSLRTRASKHEIDPRADKKFYEKFVVTYFPYKSDGTVGDRKFLFADNASDARDQIERINAAEKNGAAHTKARLLSEPDPEQIALHKQLSKELADLDRDAPGAREAYSRMLKIPERLHYETAKVMKDRIAAMYPGRENAHTRNIVLREQYNKIFAAKGLLAYQSLQRSGDFKLRYSGVHPDTNTVEPFVHSFETPQALAEAKAAVEALPPEYKISGVTVERRGLDSTYGNRPVPSTFVSDAVAMLERGARQDAEAVYKAAKAAGKSDADAAAARDAAYKDLKDRANKNSMALVNMALDALPERSIFNAYRSRTGVSGFKGDLSPLKAAYDQEARTLDDASDSRNMFQRRMESMVHQVGTLHQQAGATILKRELDERLVDLGRASLGASAGLAPITDRQYRAARHFHKALTTALDNPQVRRSRAVTNVNSGAFAFTLLGNMSSAFMNLMGAATFVYPRLASRYGGVTAAKIMVQSLKTIANSGRMRMEPVIGPDGKTMQEAVNVGVVGRSIRNYQFTDMDHSKGFNEGDNKTNALQYLVREGERRHLLLDSVLYDYLETNKTTSGAFNTAMRYGAAPMHHIERLVRESAMVSAYELELRKIASDKKSSVLTQAEMEQAAKTAVRETELMTGTVTAAAAPNWALKGIMPAVAMYKRYPLSMMQLLITDFRHGLPTVSALEAQHGKGTPELATALAERRIARLQFASTIGALGVLSGAMGMPLYGLIADVWDAAFTDEDEYDFDTLVRMSLGEFGSKGLMNYLFGLEFSSRIGLADIFYRAPLRADDQPFLMNVLEGVGGPAVSILHGWTTRSWDLASQGEYYRAAESVMPAAVRNVMRAVRYYNTGGAESLRDDIISDISPGEALAQALGFAPAGYIRQLELNSANKRISVGIESRRTKLLRRYNIAMRSGDFVTAREVREEMQEFNREHPTRRIDGETLRKSAKTFERTTEKVRNGIVYTNPTLPELQPIFRLMEEPASIWD